MGILNNLFGGSGQQTATTKHLQNTSLAQQLGNALWTTNTINPHMQQINNPHMWSQRDALTPYGETMALKAEVEELQYILKRTVENYDELVTQYKALQDIAKAEENK